MTSINSKMRGMKKRSKRVPTRERAKAEKKVREHNRKVRKEKRKNPGKVVKAARKGLRVPNDCPFKEAVLEEVEAIKQKKEQDREDRRKRLKDGVAAAAGARMAGEGVCGLGDIFINAQKKAEYFSETKEEKGANNKENSAKAYFKEFSKVVEASDVVLQVLDARDPLGTRSPDVEKAVLGNQ